MDPKLLRTIGISSGVFLLISLIAVGTTIYRNYYEIERTKLQIVQLKRDIYGK